MTPLLIALILTSPSTPPTTINHTTTRRHTTMAEPLGTAPGGGNNRTNRGAGGRQNPDPFKLNLLTNPTNRGSGYPTNRGTNPIPHTLPATFTEHTNRPR